MSFPNELKLELIKHINNSEIKIQFAIIWIYPNRIIGKLFELKKNVNVSFFDLNNFYFYYQKMQQFKQRILSILSNLPTNYHQDTIRNCVKQLFVEFFLFGHFMSPAEESDISYSKIQNKNTSYHIYLSQQTLSSVLRNPMDVFYVKLVNCWTQHEISIKLI